MQDHQDYYPGQWQNDREGQPKVDSPQEPSADSNAAADVVKAAQEEPIKVPEEAVATPPPSNPTPTPSKKKRGLSVGTWICFLCVAVVVSILSTYVLTTISNQDYYTKLLEEKQLEINVLKAKEEAEGAQAPSSDQLSALQDIFEKYAYYYGNKSEEELMEAVMKAYVEATGDLYAEYYTVEEYRAITSDRVGASVGIGVSIVQTELNVGGVVQQGFQVIAIFKNAPAEKTDLRVGDFIYRIKVDGVYKTVNELGYTEAANAVRGEAGTVAQLSALRKSGDSYVSLDFSIERAAYEKESVSYRISEADAKVGIVHISSFDLTTPHQFKEAVNALLNAGVEHFIFDVRNNPGGDLQSIKAVLTYFLQPGDLILSSITRDGKVDQPYVAEVIKWSGDYAACNVTASEIGMYADLDMVVLCNGNTASAAEVFTATLRDYELATVVGDKTFGKGIMQTTMTLSKGGKVIGYVKMTTHAYVTKCGVTYHDIGIFPDPNYTVALSEEAQQYNFYLLPEALDDQLQAAITAVKS